MSEGAASAFLDQLEDDESFAVKLESLKGDPSSVYAALQEAGFDATPEEIKMAFMERFGSELTTEQLEAIAAGISGSMVLNIVVPVAIASIVGFAAAAAFA